MKVALILFTIASFLIFGAIDIYKRSIYNGDTITIRGEPHMIIEYDYRHNRVIALSPDNEIVHWPYSN